MSDNISPEIQELIDLLHLPADAKKFFDGLDAQDNTTHSLDNWGAAVKDLATEVLDQIGTSQKDLSDLAITLSSGLDPEILNLMPGLLKPGMTADTFASKLQQFVEDGEFPDLPDHEAAPGFQDPNFLKKARDAAKGLTSGDPTKTMEFMALLMQNPGGGMEQVQDFMAQLTGKGPATGPVSKQPHDTDAGKALAAYLDDTISELAKNKYDHEGNPDAKNGSNFRAYVDENEVNQSWASKLTDPESVPKNFKTGGENFKVATYMNGATPDEMRAHLLASLKEDIKEGDFPLKGLNIDTTDPEAVTALANKIIEQLDTAKFFNKDVRAMGLDVAQSDFYNMTTPGDQSDPSRLTIPDDEAEHQYRYQYIVAAPKEETYDLGVDAIFKGIDISAARIDVTIGDDYYQNFLLDLMDETYSDVPYMKNAIFERFEEKIKNGEISIDGRDTYAETMAVFKDVIDNVGDAMYKGNTDGTFITGGTWDVEQFSTLMNAHMATAGLTLVAGVKEISGPKTALVSTNLRADIVDAGQPLTGMTLDTSTLDVTNSSNAKMFSFSDNFHIYTVDGTAQNPAFTPIENTMDGALLDAVDGEKLRALIGPEGTFDVTSIFTKDSDTDANNQPLGYFIQADSGSSFFVGYDAIPEEKPGGTQNTSDAFKALRAAAYTDDNTTEGPAQPVAAIGGADAPTTQQFHSIP